MIVTKMSQTIIKIFISNFGICDIKCLLEKSKICVNNDKTNIVGPWEKNRDNIGNNKIFFIHFLFQEVIIRNIIKIFYVNIGIITFKI